MRLSISDMSSCNSLSFIMFALSISIFENSTTNRCDQCPGPPLTNFNDGGGEGMSGRGSYFIPKKSQLQDLSSQKNHYFLLAYPKKSLNPFFATQKYPLYFFRDPKKSRSSFIDPKNYFLSKFQTQKNHPEPPSLKYLSGAPGDQCF